MKRAIPQILLVVLVFFLQGLSLQTVRSDELRPAYLQLTEIGENKFSILWRVPAVASRMRLSVDVKFIDETVNETEAFDTEIGGTSTRHWQAERKGGLRGLVVEIDGLSRTSIEVLSRIQFLDGTTFTHRFTPEAPTYRIEEQPSWGQTAGTYFVLGVEHILFGSDHLLFVLALVLLVQGKWRLIKTITAFTLAHSFTLALASLNVIRVPVPPVEACIALSIVFVACEIVRNDNGFRGLASQKPWLISFLFGLLHGLGFASALGEIGLPQNDIPTALITFNIGVEVGQLLFVFSILFIWMALRKLPVAFPKQSIRIFAYSIGTLAAAWTFERVASF